MVKFVKFLAISAFFLVLPQFSYAADLFISPASGVYRVGDLFSVLINVNTANQAINAANAQINFDNSRLEAVSIGYYGQSIFSLWTEEPSFSNAAGSIRFSGGVPSPGFNGPAGHIAKITFKAKTSGQASVAFVSAAVLANDGQGTNVIKGLSGASYTIVSALPKAEPAPAPTPVGPAPVLAPEKFVSVPIITDWPKGLEVGEVLTIKGLGFPNARILVSIQKSSDEPEIQDVFAGGDGRFVFTYSKLVESGFYRISAKNVTPDGAVSAPSDTVFIEVVNPLFFRIGTLVLNYVSIIVTLLALLLLALLIIFWLWYRMRKWRERQGKEISEAEKVLHQNFDKLKEGFSNYINYLFGSKAPEEEKHWEVDAMQEAKKDLDIIEGNIEKEIEDIKNVDNREENDHHHNRN